MKLLEKYTQEEFEKIVYNMFDEYIDYCAEPHQLSEEDMLNSINYKDFLQDCFDVPIDQISDFDEVKVFCDDYASEIFNTDRDVFLI